MKKSTTTALVAGVLTVGALGVWMGPSLIDRNNDAVAPPTAVVTPSVEAPAPRRAPAPRAVAKNIEATTIAPDVVPALPATQPDLQARIKPLLNRGTRMDSAAEGFRDAVQFATVAHAARNTGVPFAVLKHRVLEQAQTVESAIRASNPEVDAEREATRAANAARFDVAVVTG